MKQVPDSISWHLLSFTLIMTHYHKVFLKSKTSGGMMSKRYFSTLYM